TIYRYAPNDTNALYQVACAFVGQGKGNYNSLSSQAYEFVGIGAGSYLPIIFLPMPVSYQGGDIGLQLRLTKSLSLNVEGSVSDFNQNLFSNENVSQREGAIVSYLSFNPRQLRLGTLNVGDILFMLRNRYVNKLYNSIDRLNKVEYNRVWDIQDSTNQNELTNEVGFSLQPRNFVSISTTGGNLKRGKNFSSLRGNIDLKFVGDSLKLPGIFYTADYISSNDKSLDYKGVWIRQNGILQYKINPFKDNTGNARFGNYGLLVLFNGEDKEIKSIAYDTTNASSFRFYEIRPGLFVTDLFKLDL